MKTDLNKKLVLNFFLDSIGETNVAPDLELRIVKAPGLPKHYFLYWLDGQIERRETYGIYDGKVLLYLTEKRYSHAEKWMEES